MNKKYLVFAAVLFVFSFNACSVNSVKTVNVSEVNRSAATEVKADALPSWNNTSAKNGIISYISEVTDKNNPAFIPQEDRLAVFDNDGTLWAEKPVVQLLYINEKIAERVKKDPSLKNKEPYKSLLAGDLKALAGLDQKEIFKIISGLLTGMSEESYVKDVKKFFENGKYPGMNVSFDKITYKPQKELIAYLQSNGFRVYICSGGDTDFMRVISKEYYNISEEDVLGALFWYKYDYSKNELTRTDKIVTNNDMDEKPANIAARIGKKPVFACGNVGNKGDISMLFYSQGSKYRSFQMLVNHDDAQREFVYGEDGNTSLNEAARHGWRVISMKNDWKEIF